MKLSTQWKTLTRDQRRAWNAWAKSNKVLLDDGSERRVSGHKAMTMVLRNRAIAGDASNPAVLPVAVAWLVGALSLRDGGPFTENLGLVGFRTEQALTADMKWFVWATRPVVAEEDPQRQLRFVTCFVPGAVNADELIGINAPYLAVHGSWDGPGESGAWPVDMFIWFRVHHYSGGHLGPGVVMRGQIQVEL